MTRRRITRSLWEPPGARRTGGVPGPGRLHALIDGVFAIALTLLVLDLPRPAHSTPLMYDLQQHWPTYGAYLISFATLAIIGIKHHGMMGAATAIDRRFLELTLVFLLFVSIIPWPTALATDCVDARWHDARTPTASP